jgi:hypothetical protein
VGGDKQFIPNLVGKFLGKRPLVRLRSLCEDDIKMDLTWAVMIGGRGNLAEDCVQ